MPLYEVIVTRDATMSCPIRVDAPTPEAADDKALSLAGPYGQRLSGWALDEGNMNRVYIGAPGEATLAEGPAEPRTRFVFRRGDEVRFKGSLKALGIKPTPTQADMLADVLKVERSEFTPVDDDPGFQTVFLVGLPWMFGSDSLELVY